MIHAFPLTDQQRYAYHDGQLKLVFVPVEPQRRWDSIEPHPTYKNEFLPWKNGDWFEQNTPTAKPAHSPAIPKVKR